MIVDIPISIEDISYAIGADNLQSKGLTGAGVKIGIVDSGVNHHNVVNSKTFVGGDTKDNAGHGTAIADIITGIAPDVEIVSAKIYHIDSIDVQTGIDGIRWCAEQGCKIINCSWGTRLHFQQFHDVIKEVKSKYGSICVFPTGNYGFGTLLCPADDENAVGVGAIPLHPEKYYISKFSGFGTTAFGNIKPDIVAYGGGINECIDTSVGCVKGTSFAVPVVVGAMALIYHQHSTKDALIASLTKNAKDVGTSGADRYSGYGSVNVSDAYNNPVHGQYVPAKNKNFENFAMILGLGAIAAYLISR